MLILSRHIGESINIGDNVKLTVLNVRDCQAHIGIAAPRDVPVHREEIFYRIKTGVLESEVAEGARYTG